MLQSGQGKLNFYLQFGGQGTPWFKELSSHYKNPYFERFFETVIRTLEEELASLETGISLPQGLDLRSWLRDPDTIPSEQYLSYAAVSVPLIQITQASHLENLCARGISREYLLERCVGGSGHSQGISSAVLAALQTKTSDDYYEAISKFVRFHLCLGVSAQKAFPYLSPTPEEVEKSTILGASMPSPMVAVVGSKRSVIEALIREMNEELAEDRKIYISLYNSPSNHILSSFPSSLIAFHKKNKEKIDAKEFRWVYLMATCPFHSPHMKPIQDIFEPEIKRIRFSYSGKDIHFPVYSFCDSVNYQDIGDDLSYRMYKDIMIHTLHWDRAVKPSLEHPDLDLLVDLGPGKAIQRLTTEILQTLNIDKPILSIITSNGLEKFLDLLQGKNG